MKEVYSSLFKGNVHLTTKFSSRHPANDFGNYKTRNHIYSAAKLGNGTVQIVRTYYKSPANGKTYKNSLVVWIKYDNGMRCGMYHGYVKDRIVKVGDRVYPGMRVYRTGNTGNSRGDHLHYNLQNSKNQNIDPYKWVTNDKTVLLTKGQKLEMLKSMNIRDKNFKDIGDAMKGSVCVISSYYKEHKGYNYYLVQFGDVECYIADTNLNKVTTKKVTNLDGSKVVECEDIIDGLQDEINSLKAIVERQKIEIVRLESQVLEMEVENAKLEKYKAFYEGLGKYIEVKKV